MSSIEMYLRQLAPNGIQLHVWPTAGGRFQANVSEPGCDGWTCETRDDPLEAICTVLRLRAGGVATRTVVARDGLVPPSRQIDIEEVIETVQVAPDTYVFAPPAADDDFGDL